MPIGDRGGRSIDGRREPLSGHVATVNFVIEFPVTQRGRAASSSKDESEALDVLRSQYGAELHTIARREFRRVLGPRVEIDPVAIRQGSVEIVVVVSAIAAVLGHYTELVNKMSEAIESTRRLYRQSMDVWGLSRNNMILVADWEPGAAALQLEASSKAADNAFLRPAGGSPNLRLDPGMRRELTAVAWTVQIALLVAILVTIITRT